nr:hypothetical protein [uncultured Dysosmobacter sp.]
MKNTGKCPKCGGADLVLVPGGRATMDSALNLIHVGFRSVGVDRYVCCTCGFSEEWVAADGLEKVKKYWAENVL